MMLEELQRCDYSQSEARIYHHAVEDFLKYLPRSPYRLGPDHIRQYQFHLFRDHKFSPGTIGLRTCALRFPFVKTLGRPYLPYYIPFPKNHLRLPPIHDQQRVVRLAGIAERIEACGARLLYLPTYSPDLNPLEKAWSKIEQYWRKAKGCTAETLDQAINEALQIITADNSQAWFRHCEYRTHN
jgi:transposase